MYLFQYVVCDIYCFNIIFFGMLNVVQTFGLGWAFSVETWMGIQLADHNLFWIEALFFVMLFRCFT